MSMYSSGYTNEAGEPIMDAAAYRYEQYLDSDPMNHYCDTCGFSHGGPCPDDCDDDYDTYDIVLTVRDFDGSRDEAETVMRELMDLISDKGYDVGARVV